MWASPRLSLIHIFCQLTADMFGRQAIRMETTDTTSLGAAILGYVALGIYPDYQSAAAQMVRPGRIFEPDPENVKRFNQLYPQYQQDLERRIHFNVKRG